MLEEDANMGRKATARDEGARTARIEARVPEALKAQLARAAALRGQSLSDFVLTTAAAAARDVLREHEILELTERDQQALAAALLEPEPPSERLVRAARWYRDHFEP
jgi:uncharacterized protein (DUF1778 family)